MTKINVLTLFIALIVIMSATSVLGAHSATGVLTPEWSPAGVLVEYDVEICNEAGSDAIDEVRVIKNPTYADIDCEDLSLAGWITSEVSPWFDGDVGGLTEMCWFFTIAPANNLEAGECQIFEFSATTPAVENCELDWKFETRDEETSTQGDWESIFVSTGVDSTPPELVKTMVSGPYDERDGSCPPAPDSAEECWITQSTVISVEVTDPGDDTCDGDDVIPSSMDYCVYSLVLDGTFEENWTVYDNDVGDINDDTNVIEHEVQFDEDSLHELTITCYDVAGNMITEMEKFRVDDEEPTTAKNFTGPQKFDDGASGVIEWIDGVTVINLFSEDPEAATTPAGYDCSIGVDKTWYRVSLLDGESACWEPDLNCNAGDLGMRNPYEMNGVPECIDAAQGRCTVAYPDTSSDDWFDCVEGYAWNPDFCNLDTEWHLYRGVPIGGIEESCHAIQYFSVDHLGNVEDSNFNCFFVDKTPPVVTKTHDNAMLEDVDLALNATDNTTNGVFHWMTSNMTIDFECADQAPHPSNGEMLYLQFSYDMMPTLNYTTMKCAEYSGIMEGEWCVFDMTDDRLLTVAFAEESLHSLEYYCEDAVSKISEIELQYYKVDNTPPEIVKLVSDTNYGICPPAPGSDDVCYITPHTNITVNVSDPDTTGMGCNSDEVSCTWSYYWNGTFIMGDVFNEPGTIITLPEDSSHELHILCMDSLGNAYEDIETFLVDDIPPTTTKEIGDPFVFDTYPKDCDMYLKGGLDVPLELLEPCGFAEWINNETPITMNATDAKSGVQVTKWRNLLIDPAGEDQVCGGAGLIRTTALDVCLPGEPCEVVPMGFCHPEFYETYVLNPDEPWTNYTEPFFKPEESCHVIEYYSIDNVNNEEWLKSNCLFVDLTPPTFEKLVGEPRVPGNIVEGVECNVTEVNGTAVDKLDVLFLFDLTGSMGGELTSAKTEAIDLMNEISGLVPDSEFGAASFMDANGNMGGCDYGPTSYGSGSDYQWALDQDITATVGDVSAAINGLVLGSGDDGPEGYTHALDKTQDAAWRSGAQRVVVIFQDNVPHDCNLGAFDGCTATTGPDAGADGVTETGDDPTWVGVAAQLKAAGIKVISVDSGSANTCRDSVWGYMADETGGIAASAGSDFTDTIVGLVGEVIIDCETDVDFYITQQTPIYFNCTDDDGQPHPVDHVSLGYRYRLADTCAELPDAVFTDWINVTGNGSGYLLEDTFFFPEDSCHEIEYYCFDGLGNAYEHKFEIDVVDTVPPETDLTIEGPVFYDGDLTYTDTVTTFELSAEDPEPHPVGLNVTEYRVSNPLLDRYCLDCAGWMTALRPAMGPWQTYSGPFDIPDESCHVIEYRSVDNLGNEESIGWECVFADHTPPVIDKTYSEPYYVEHINGSHVEWISVETQITVAVVDADPHPSGVDTVDYRVTLLGSDEACWNETLCEEAVGDGVWETGSEAFSFNIGEESCHLIEIVAVDNVNKTNNHKQCVFVDDTAPFPNKTVGIPKSLMSDLNQELGAAFYPELGEGVCDEDGNGNGLEDECWDITLLTPIDLACVDPDPHPSGADEVCFMVDFDDEDVTDDYCEGASGDMNDNGYCCVEELGEFRFNKQSWHKLSYYCVDNVNNSGEEVVDVEYFKVQETKFEIQLNKKWNLISVPVKLLDNSMDEVFAGLEDVVVSVWQFDGVNWHIYTPDGIDNDDITTMEPGWGYWILTTDDALLTIGGNLLSPAITPPSVPVVHGWNLLGYFGAEEEDGYYWPDGNGQMAQCVLYNIGDSIWDKAFGAVDGYWEPFNPDMWTLYGRHDNLDPGAGYWVFATEEGIHTLPPKNCGELFVS